MTDTFGTDFRVTLTGTARGESVGCIIEGVPAGTELDCALIRHELYRRAPSGKNATSRREPDEFIISSGVQGGVCDGGAITAVIFNRDARHGDSASIPRPSHADLALKAKFGADFDAYNYVCSGRMTAPVVFAGAIAKQLLCARGVEIASHILSIGRVRDASFMDGFDPDKPRFMDTSFPLIDAARRADMEAELDAAGADGDTLGGSIECAVTGLPMGLGEPYFNKLTSRLASALFSIPAARRVWFGREDIDGLYGSAANDPIGITDGRVLPQKNDAGGVNGGMANGMPLIFGVAFRPVPTLKKPQRTVDMLTATEIVHAFTSRSDVCVLPRAAVAVEATAAIALEDMLR